VGDLLMKNEKEFSSGLIVMGDLSRWKMKRFSKWSYYNG
jgi:hypothetical protein